MCATASAAHVHQAYRDGMEDQLGALGLILNATVLWTTKYIDAAVAQFRAEGHEIRDEDIARLSPLKHANLNVLGRYSFTASTPAAGALRPLRDPDAPVLDEDDEEQRSSWCLPPGPGSWSGWERFAPGGCRRWAAVETCRAWPCRGRCRQAAGSAVSWSLMSVRL